MLDIFDDLFTQGELAAFNQVSPQNVDVDELKKTGIVTQETKVDNGMITETYHYESFDKKVRFSRTHSFYEDHKDYEDIKKINAKIQLNINKENYERCAELVSEKNNILKKIKEKV